MEGPSETTVGKMPVDFLARITASLSSSFKNGSFSITSNHQYHYILAIKKAVEFSKIVPSTNVPISCTLWPIILATNLTGIFLTVVSRVEHGYTAGRVFPHRTRTRVHRYPLQVAPVPYRNSCGVQRYLQYPRGFFFIISLRTNLIVYLN